jgi:hypothetical protein
MEARKEDALEAVAHGLAHTVTLEVALRWDERLGELLAALNACPEFLGPPVGVEVDRA